MLPLLPLLRLVPLPTRKRSASHSTSILPTAVSAENKVLEHVARPGAVRDDNGDDGDGVAWMYEEVECGLDDNMSSSSSSSSPFAADIIPP